MHNIKLSPYHKIFYNEWKLDPTSSRYNIVFDQTLSASLNVTNLKNALHLFISDYLIMNSHIDIIGGEPHWVPNSSIKLLEHFHGAYTNKQIFEFVSAPFDLESDSLYRFAVFNEEHSGGYRLILVLNHILIDGNSFNEFILAVSNYYNGVKNNNYIIYSEQKQSITSTTELLEQQLSNTLNVKRQFWSDVLIDVEPTDLRFIKRSESIPESQEQFENHIKGIKFGFSRDVIDKLSWIKEHYNITPYSYGLIVFAILDRTPLIGHRNYKDFLFIKIFHICIIFLSNFIFLLIFIVSSSSKL